VFAGAAREAVFSSEAVVRRVNRDFIPVALKAAQINNPPPGVEGDLYAEIGRSKPAPQGICVTNSDGKVLNWVLSFDDDAGVEEFLDHAARRYKERPDASRPVAAERHMKFPSLKLPDVQDSGRRPTIPERHAAGEHCLGTPIVEPGTLIGRIVGRPLDNEGRPIEKTARQEDYMEARFEVPVGLQRQFTRALADVAPGESFAVPRDLARSLVSHAYLGQLDVNPLGGRQVGGKTDHEAIEFRGRRASGDGKRQSVHVTGTSVVAGSQGDGGVRTDGRLWEHRVQLEWEGYIDIEGDRFTQLVLTAEGTERLRWGSRRFSLNPEPDVAHLMAGHPIDLNADVRYGLIAAPFADDAVAGAAGEGNSTPGAAAQAEGRAPTGNRPETESPPAKQLTLRERVHHLREAVKHLRAGGLGDLADQLARQVERMEQALENERKRGTN
jgi:hypothetical protein